MAEPDKKTGFGHGLIIGAMIGAGIVLLTSAATGRETRTMLKEKTSKMARGIAATVYSELKNRLEKPGP